MTILRADLCSEASLQGSCGLAWVLLPAVTGSPCCAGRGAGGGQSWARQQAVPLGKQLLEGRGEGTGEEKEGDTVLGEGPVKISWPLRIRPGLEVGVVTGLVLPAPGGPVLGGLRGQPPPPSLRQRLC